MRQDHQQFVERDTEIIVVAPDNQRRLFGYWRKEKLPFIALPDPKHDVSAALYRQEFSLLKLGRMPALLIIDKAGTIQHQYYSNSMSDIPPNDEVLAILDQLNTQS